MKIFEVNWLCKIDCNLLNIKFENSCMLYCVKYQKKFHSVDIFETFQTLNFPETVLWGLKDVMMLNHTSALVYGPEWITSKSCSMDGARLSRTNVNYLKVYILVSLVATTKSSNKKVVSSSLPCTLYGGCLLC